MTNTELSNVDIAKIKDAILNHLKTQNRLNINALCSELSTEINYQPKVIRKYTNQIIEDGYIDNFKSILTYNDNANYFEGYVKKLNKEIEEENEKQDNLNKKQERNNTLTDLQIKLLKIQTHPCTIFGVALAIIVSIFQIFDWIFNIIPH